MAYDAAMATHLVNTTRATTLAARATKAEANEAAEKASDEARVGVHPIPMHV